MVAIAVLAAMGSVMAEDLQITASPPWQEAIDNEQKCYTLEYSGQGWPGLSFSPVIKPDNYYMVSWKMKSSVEEKETQFALVAELSGKSGNASYVLTKDWSDYTWYFYSGKASNINLRLNANPGAAKTITLKDVKVTLVTPEMLSQNLLTDGNFENGSGIPANWWKTWDTTVNPAVISGSQGFISGEKSMEVNFAAQDKGVAGIQCIQMPAVPGKEFEFKFWAKSESDYAISMSLQAWSQFGHTGEHFYKFEKFKITPEWKEYSLRATIPTDVAKYPDLKDQVMFISITGEKGQTGKVWFDDMLFREIAGAQAK